MNIKTKISSLISTSPDLIQFAKDRKFEESWIIPFTKEKPTLEEVEKYIHKDCYQILIVEYIWNSAIDKERFVLTVFFDDSCKLKIGQEIINLCLDSFYQRINFEALIDTINKKIIGYDHILNTPVESINLGIFNHWLSTNPIELWEIGKEYHKTEMIKAIESRPDIYKTELNFQGLQFRFNLSKKQLGPYYGFKTPCCDLSKGVWTINFDVVDYWINKLLIN